MLFTNVNSIDNITDNQAKKIANIIKRTSPILKDFAYDGFSEKNEMIQWGFSHKFQTKSPNYTFKIIFAEKDGKWSAKIFVYWRKQTKDVTVGAGKDFDYTLGPYDFFSELLKNIDLKVKNNPILNHQVYDDDFEFNMDKEAVPLLIQLKKEKDKLFSVENSFFNDLKKIYKKIQNIPEDKFLDYCRIHNKSEDDKSGFIFTLQKLHKLDYYMAMKKIGQI